MNHEAIDVVNTLRAAAAEIDAKWRSFDFTVDAFPTIVLDETRDIDFSALGSTRALCELLDNPGIADCQIESTFSDLYLRLYDNGRFWIEVLNWWDSDINIHDHDFSGVQFQVTGRSLSVSHDFASQVKVGGLDFGELTVRAVQLWEQANRSTVYPGCPHIVKHLNVPTISLLIRTHPVPALGPQHNYFPPGVVGNYGVADTVFRKKIKALRILSRWRPDEFRECFRSVVAGQTLEQLLFTLSKLSDAIFDEAYAPLLHELTDQGQEYVAVVEAITFYRASELILKSLMSGEAWDSTERLFLAALSCSFDRRSYDFIMRGAIGGSGIVPGDILHRVIAKMPEADGLEIGNIYRLLDLEELLPTTP
jgi:hypothetical protein